MHCLQRQPRAPVVDVAGATRVDVAPEDGDHRASGGGERRRLVSKDTAVERDDTVCCNLATTTTTQITNILW